MARRVKPRRRPVRGTEEFPEEETSSSENTAMSMDKTALNAEGDVTEGLAVDEEVEIVKRKRS